MTNNNTENKTAEPRLKRIIARAGLILGSFLTLWIVSSIASVCLVWLAGVQLGFNPFDYSNLTDTQRAQEIIAPALIIVVLGVLLIQWLKARKRKFWKYMRIETLILLPIALVANLGFASYLFIKGQHGGDYGCSQEVSLNTAYDATYPISTNTGDSGTAFAINSSGTLLTAYHVIEGAKEVDVDLNNTTAKVTVIKTDPKYDVALLHYNQAAPDFLPLTSTYNVADPVYVIGWPENVYDSGEPTFTSGIISRDISSSDANASGQKTPSGLSYIQTDAATGPGDSGGPVIDTCGAVGVVDAGSIEADGVTPDDGIGYAISAQSAKAGLGLH